MSRLRWRSRTFIGALILALGLTLPASVATAQASQSELKAAIIFNFGRFVSWRAGHQDDLVRLCVSLDADVSEDLLRIGATSKDKTNIRIAPFDPTGWTQCDLVYLSDTDATAPLISRLNSEGRVTISSREGFAETGMIEVIRIGRQYRFEINNTLARNNGVTISSRLLRIAARVH